MVLATLHGGRLHDTSTVTQAYPVIFIAESVSTCNHIHTVYILLTYS